MSIFDRSPIKPSSRKARVRCMAICAAVALASCGSSGGGKAGFESRLTVGEQFLNSGKYAEGYEILEEIEIAHRGSAKASLALADVYFRQDAFLRAKTHYTNAIEEGRELEGTLGKARVALAQNRGQDALNLYAEILSEEPELVDAHNGLGVAYDLLGDHEKARESYSKALSLAPNHFAARNNLGLSLALGGKSAHAVELLSDLSRSFLDSSKVRQNLAFAFQMNGQDAESLRVSKIDLSESDSRNNQRIFKRFRTRG